MIGDPGGDSAAAGPPRRTSAASVLADRIAATLVRHEPGWRLPRLTALARRYQVSPGEVDAALDELAARHLLRRLPDGQVYRVSPAEYRIPLEGVADLASHVDPMGGRLVRRSRQVSWRRPPQSVAQSLGLAPDEAALVVRCLWTVGGEPGALSASYVPGPLAESLGDLPPPPFGCDLGAGAPPPRAPAPGAVAEAGLDAGRRSQPRSVQIELAPPPPSAARLLRVSAAEQVATVTVCFENPRTSDPAALTCVMLRLGMFRVIVQAPAAGAAAAGQAPGDGRAAIWEDDVPEWAV